MEFFNNNKKSRKNKKFFIGAKKGRVVECVGLPIHILKIHFEEFNKKSNPLIIEAPLYDHGSAKYEFDVS